MLINMLSDNCYLVVDATLFIMTHYREKLGNTYSSSWVQEMMTRGRLKIIERATPTRKQKVELEKVGFRSTHEDYKYYFEQLQLLFRESLSQMIKILSKHRLS